MPRPSRAGVVHIGVTGAAGFLGRHLVPRLLADGHRVVGLTRSGDPRLPAGVHHVRGDLFDGAALAEIARTDAVVHLAAVSSVPGAQQDASNAFHVNAEGTAALLDAVRSAPGSPRVVVMSTGHVYGRPLRSPVDEDEPLKPLSVYGWTKLAAEAAVGAYAAAYGLDAVVFRAFNIYGPGQDPSFVIPTIVEQALRGQDIRLGNADVIRDFLHVDDFCSAMTAALTAQEARGQTMNLGAGEGRSLREIVATVGSILGKELRVVVEPERVRKDDPEQIVVNAAEARRLLAWRPRVGLEEGLGTLVPQAERVV